MSAPALLVMVFFISFLGALLWRHMKYLNRFDQNIFPKTIQKYTGKIRKIVDGDSLYIEGIDKQIRLWGIDAPESDEVGYQDATNALHKIVEGRTLIVEQVDTDVHGRIVGRCFYTQGAKRFEVNRQLLETGQVREYMKFTKGYYGGAK